MPRRPGVVDSEKYESARELRAAGHSLTAIANATGAAYSTVHRWTRDVRPDLARPAEHTEAIRRSRATATAALAEELERGGCGTPGCTDLDCPITYGLCHCGCGDLAPIAGMSERRRGFIRGEPHLFILGHNRRGLSPGPLSEEGRRILSATMTANRANGTISTARVAYGRHGSTRVFGREAAQRAAARGKKVGRKLNARQVERVNSRAEEIRRALPEVTDEQLVDLLIDRFKGREALTLPDGTRRGRRDTTYRAARQWVERRLKAAQAYT